MVAPITPAKTPELIGKKSQFSSFFIHSHYLHHAQKHVAICRRQPIEPIFCCWFVAAEIRPGHMNYYVWGCWRCFVLVLPPGCICVCCDCFRDFGGESADPNGLIYSPRGTACLGSGHVTLDKGKAGRINNNSVLINAANNGLRNNTDMA